VPAVKFALGVAGVAAVVAIVGGFEDYRVAVFGTTIMFGLMFVLLAGGNPVRFQSLSFDLREAPILTST